MERFGAALPTTEKITESAGNQLLQGHRKDPGAESPEQTRGKHGYKSSINTYAPGVTACNFVQ